MSKITRCMIAIVGTVLVLSPNGAALAQKTPVIIVDIDGHQAIVEETLPISAV